MFNTALCAEMIKFAHGYGFAVPSVTFDWPTIKAKRDALVERLRGLYLTGTSKLVKIIIGKAKFVGPKEIQVNGQIFTADHIVIAVGGRPAMPPIMGTQYALNSDSFFDMPQLPKKVALVGAGYIAVELAGVLHSLGADTTMFIRGEALLRQFDPMVQQMVTEEYEKMGVKLVKHSHVIGLEDDHGRKSVVFTVNDVENRLEGFDEVIFAIGREANVEHLGLDVAGVQLDKSNRIIVDEKENTTAAGVYALGDCTIHDWDLTPVAIAAGRRLGDRLFGGVAEAYLHYEEIPSVVFSHPTVGTIGYTEPEAKRKFGESNVTVYNSVFTNMFFSIVEPEHRQKTGMKLVCVGDHQQVIGLHVVGLGADEMVQGFAVAVKMGATKSDFDNCVAIHPTASEEFVTMGKWGKLKDHVTLPPPKIDRSRI
eukprot:c13252_g1_i1.p1 GENE.c13252_g1_i1~~c13252_g1_i1.p1  ORF type:complete len:492 (+),score=156.88 c13252_g1_i1:205-1476(+)